jgi:hypothetical protein
VQKKKRIHHRVTENTGKREVDPSAKGQSPKRFSEKSRRKEKRLLLVG